MSILKITSTGVECRPTLPELGWRLSRSAFTRLNSWSSSSSSSRRASWGSNSSSSLGTISKRFTGSYPSTIMVASLLWRFLGIGILQERPISHRKLSRFVRGQEPGRCHCQPHRKEAEALPKPDAVRPLAELRRHALEGHDPYSREAQHRPQEEGERQRRAR